MKKKEPASVKHSAPENDLSESIIGSLPGLFYFYDDTGKFIHWNRNFEVVSGYTGKEISTMHPLQFFDEGEKDILSEKIAEVFEKGQAFIEAHFYTKDKRRIPYYFNGFAITYRQKRCLIGVGIDITERVEAEQKRLKSEDQLRETEQSLRKLNRELYLLNNANRIIFKSSDEKTLMKDICNLLVNEGLYCMAWMGLVPEADQKPRLVIPMSMAGAGKERSAEIILDLHDAEQIKGPAARAILSGMPVIVNHIAAEPGHKRWKEAAAHYGFASSISFPLIVEGKISVSFNIYSTNTYSFDADEVKMLSSIADNLSYAIGGIRNAENKMEAEKKLAYNEENLRQIFSSTYDIIFMLSVEEGKRYKFISVNSAFLNTTGLKHEQVFNKYLDEVIPPESLPVVLEKYDLAFRTGKPVQWEETSQYPSGTKVGIVTITPVRNGQGEFSHLVGFVHDISERKKAEQDMDELNTRLRNLSNHLHTISEAERTSIAREIHDVLGQQMTALKFDISWLKKRKRTDLGEEESVKAEKEYKERLEDMNKRLDEAILSIRKVSSELRPKMLDDLGLNAALEWYIREFEKNTGIPCTLDSDFEDLCFEKPVSITIYRILQEALTNVARHSEAKHVEIFARHDDKLISVEVKDNGKGITEEDKQHGASFGLLGMSERAKMINGTVTIKGIRGKGTSVLLTVPYS
ncbi:MAG: PAS domain S-box protein [Bacteroidia bacterium]